MRILIVEDEPKTAAYAKKGLTEHGFVVDIAANGVDGRHLALTSDYDLVILDIMLPGADGWTVLREIREKKQRSEEHTSELQSPCNLVCRLLLEKKKTVLV